jgi:hypothetical protein
LTPSLSFLKIKLARTPKSGQENEREEKGETRFKIKSKMRRFNLVLDLILNLVLKEI